MVAAKLDHIRSTFTTASGRIVDLRVYAEGDDVTKCDHAMESLKASMSWDERAFGLEYDLDIYSVVAVKDFSMGAMENKSLNIFNTAYVLATPDMTTGV